MTNRQQEVQYLRFEKGYTLKQISNILGISIGRVQQLSAKVSSMNDELSFEDCIKLIDSKTIWGKPRITVEELNAIKRCLVKYYDLSKKEE